MSGNHSSSSSSVARSSIVVVRSLWLTSLMVSVDECASFRPPPPLPLSMLPSRSVVAPFSSRQWASDPTTTTTTTIERRFEERDDDVSSSRRRLRRLWGSTTKRTTIASRVGGEVVDAARRRGRVVLLFLAACLVAWSSLPLRAVASSAVATAASPLASLDSFVGASSPPPPPSSSTAVVSVVGGVGRRSLGSFRLTPSAAEAECVFRMAVAGACGGAIGAERKSRRDRPAGVRTMALVSLGACVFTLCSVHGFSACATSATARVDPSRMASNVASGVGFVGAGVITTNRDADGGTVNGLATAAAIWVAAATGVAVGVGLYFVGAAAAAGTIAVLKYGKRFAESTTSLDKAPPPRPSVSKARRIEFDMESSLPLVEVVHDDVFSNVTTTSTSTSASKKKKNKNKTTTKQRSRPSTAVVDDGADDLDSNRGSARGDEATIRNDDADDYVSARLLVRNDDNDEESSSSLSP